jgi:hypothetical protein
MQVVLYAFIDFSAVSHLTRVTSYTIGELPVNLVSISQRAQTCSVYFYYFLSDWENNQIDHQ